MSIHVVFCFLSVMRFVKKRSGSKKKMIKGASYHALHV